MNTAKDLDTKLDTVKDVDTDWRRMCWERVYTVKVLDTMSKPRTLIDLRFIDERVWRAFASHLHLLTRTT